LIVSVILEYEFMIYHIIMDKHSNDYDVAQLIEQIRVEGTHAVTMTTTLAKELFNRLAHNIH